MTSIPKRSKNNLQNGSIVASINKTDIEDFLLRGLSREHIKV